MIKKYQKEIAGSNLIENIKEREILIRIKCYITISKFITKFKKQNWKFLNAMEYMKQIAITPMKRNTGKIREVLEDAAANTWPI